MLSLRETWCWLAFTLLLPHAMATAARATELARFLPGPVRATVERVVDGDTLEVRAQIWLGQEVRVLARVAGVDTPELAGQCQLERALAAQARDFVQRFAGSGAVILRDIKQDKYGGRVVARVSNAQNRDLSGALIEAGLARRYAGGKRGDWWVAQSSLEAPP